MKAIRLPKASDDNDDLVLAHVTHLISICCNSTQPHISSGVELVLPFSVGYEIVRDGDHPSLHHPFYTVLVGIWSGITGCISSARKLRNLLSTRGEPYTQSTYSSTAPKRPSSSGRFFECIPCLFIFERVEAGYSPGKQPFDLRDELPLRCGSIAENTTGTLRMLADFAAQYAAFLMIVLSPDATPANIAGW